MTRPGQPKPKGPAPGLGKATPEQIRRRKLALELLEKRTGVREETRKDRIERTRRKLNIPKREI